MDIYDLNQSVNKISFVLEGVLQQLLIQLHDQQQQQQGEQLQQLEEQ